MNKTMQKSSSKPSPHLQNIKTIDKKSVIILAISFILFLCALLWINSDDILHGAGEIFTSQGDELSEYEKASVTGIISESLKSEEVADGAYSGEQKIAVIVKSGRYKGEELVANNFFMPLNGVPVSEGDNVTLLIKTYSDGERYASVYEINRIPVLAVYLVLFFIIIVIVGGLTGMKSR